MSRDLSPIWKKSRALGFSLLENKKEFSRGKKRLTPPGQHGNSKTRKRKVSLYASQNKEKQKLRFLYGLREKQLKNLFLDLKQKEGDILQHIPTRLESRLDNLVFRAGFGTRRFARQWVNHGHVSVDNKKVDKVGYLVKPGSIITLSKKSQDNEIIKQWLKQNVKPPAFLEVNKEEMTIIYSHYPSPEELKKDIDIASALEWYNKRI